MASYGRYQEDLSKRDKWCEAKRILCASTNIYATHETIGDCRNAALPHCHATANTILSSEIAHLIANLRAEQFMSQAQIRTLIVDDNPSFLRSVSQMIASYGELTLVGEARSAAGAVEQIALLHPDFVLMDMVMPDLNGFEATRIIKTRPGAPRVIICTLYDDKRYADAAMAVGADGFLAKSALSKQLLAVIHSLFNLHQS